MIHSPAKRIRREVQRLNITKYKNTTLDLSKMAKSYKEEKKRKFVMERHKFLLLERFLGSRGDRNFLTIAKLLENQESSEMTILLCISGGSYTKYIRFYY